LATTKNNSFAKKGLEYRTRIMLNEQTVSNCIYKKSSCYKLKKELQRHRRIQTTNYIRNKKKVNLNLILFPDTFKRE